MTSLQFHTHRDGAEHLGLIPPQMCQGPNEPVDSFMRAAPTPNEDQTASPEDEAIADPLAIETDALWNDTARKNREIFTEIFRPVPTNLVRDWDAYPVRSATPLVSNGVLIPSVELRAEDEDEPCCA